MRSVSILLPIALLLVALVTAKGNQAQSDAKLNEDLLGDAGAQLNSLNDLGDPTRTVAAARAHQHTSCGVTVINSGDNVGLMANVTGTCTFSDEYSFYSNNFFVGNYTGDDDCHLKLWTIEPRFLVVEAEYVQIPSPDSLYLFTPGSRRKRVMEKHEGYYAFLLTTFDDVNFNTRKGGHGFKLNFLLGNSECHQRILVDSGASGSVSVWNYPRNTVCQYWFETDPGYGMLINFTHFNIGRRGGCTGDNIIVEYTGDPKYATNFERFCNKGFVPDQPLKSVGTELNVLLNGLNSMAGAGFTFVYSTFELPSNLLI